MQNLHPHMATNLGSTHSLGPLLTLPERVLQFGTGVLLRGLPDYFIDKANKAGLFNGRVVVIKSTQRAGADAFEQQGGLYTHLIRGIEAGQKIETTLVNASISRVVNANYQWADILACARNTAIDIIISNTTEVGLVLDKEDKVAATPPTSFPGKLLAILLERYKSSGEAAAPGFVIVPTELIPDNGKVLQDICNQLAALNGLDAAFVHWMNQANQFCSSLVDRIVPGTPAPEDKAEAEAALGFADDLMIMSEPYRLWAIEAASQVVQAKLTFAQADKGVVIAPDIDKFRELKLRLLNGTHSFSCGMAIMAGFDTVKSAMQHEGMYQFISKLMLQEMVPCITGASISPEEATAFARQVLDRFANPYINHKWHSISAQYTGKMHMRNVPMIGTYIARYNQPPALMAMGFAAYLHIMADSILPTDDPRKPWYADHFDASQPADAVPHALAQTDFWGTNLNDLPGWTDAVLDAYQQLEQQGALRCIEDFMSSESLEKK